MEAIYAKVVSIKGLVKKYRRGGGLGQSIEGVGHEVLGFEPCAKRWVVQFSAILSGWVTLFYYIDRH